MTLRRKLLTAYGALALLVLLIAGMTFWTIAQWSGSSGELEDHYRRSLLLQRVRAATFRAFKEVPDAVTGGDADARQEFDALLAPVEDDFAQWEQLATTEPEREQVRQVRQALDALVADANTVFDLMAQGRRDEAYAIMEGRLEDERLGPFEDLTAAAVASDQANREIVREDIARTKRTTQLVVGLAAFGIVSVSLLIAAYLASDLFGPLRQVRSALGDVERGDLKPQLDEARRDELGEVNRAFNEMVTALARRQQSSAPTDLPTGDGSSAPVLAQPANWRGMPSRLVLHALVAELRSRVAGLSGEATDGELPVDDRRALIEQLDQLSLAVTRLTEFGMPLDLNLARTDIRALLYEVLLRFHDDFARRTISFELAIAPEVGELVVDRLKLRQALGELVRNALDALPEQGGRLGIRASPAAEGKGLMVEVADDGSSVAAREIADLLAPFATTRDHRAGVGLTLTKAVVEQHGGQLRIDSEPGAGTVVQVLLPDR